MTYGFTTPLGAGVNAFGNLPLTGINWNPLNPIFPLNAINAINPIQAFNANAGINPICGVTGWGGALVNPGLTWNPGPIAQNAAIAPWVAARYNPAITCATGINPGVPFGVAQLNTPNVGNPNVINATNPINGTNPINPANVTGTGFAAQSTNPGNCGYNANAGGSNYGAGVPWATINPGFIGNPIGATPFGYGSYPAYSYPTCSYPTYNYGSFFPSYFGYWGSGAPVAFGWPGIAAQSNPFVAQANPATAAYGSFTTSPFFAAATPWTAPNSGAPFNPQAGTCNAPGNFPAATTGTDINVEAFVPATTRGGPQGTLVHSHSGSFFHLPTGTFCHRPSGTILNIPSGVAMVGTGISGGSESVSKAAACFFAHPATQWINNAGAQWSLGEFFDYVSRS